MSAPVSKTAESARCWVEVRDESDGRCTAQVVGLPELRASAASPEEAIGQVRAMLGEWVAEGRLIPVDVSVTNPLLSFSGHLDPNDPLEKEFVEELARIRKEDLERTLREYDQQCCDSSSTPTT